MGGIRAKLDGGAIVWIIFMWSIFTSIQISSLIYCHHLCTTPATILSWGYFDTPAILFKTSDSVAVLWLTATLARINKRKWSFRAPLVYVNHFFLITRKLVWHSNLNESQRKNFVLILIQLSKVKIQQSYEFFELL